jgi:hypothetical protein
VQNPHSLVSLEIEPFPFERWGHFLFRPDTFGHTRRFFSKIGLDSRLGNEDDSACEPSSKQSGLFAPGVSRMTSFRIAICLMLLAVGGCALGTSVSSPGQETSIEPSSDGSRAASETKVQQMPRIRPWGRTQEKGSGLAPEAKAIERSLGYQ